MALVQRARAYLTGLDDSLVRVQPIPERLRDLAELLKQDHEGAFEKLRRSEGAQISGLSKTALIAWSGRVGYGQRTAWRPERCRKLRKKRANHSNRRDLPDQRV